METSTLLTQLAHALEHGTTLPTPDVAHLTTQDLPEREAIGLLVLLTKDMEWSRALHKAWGAPAGSVLSLVALHAELDALDEDIDRGIAASDASVVQDLVRADLPWEHPELASLLNLESTRASASILLAQHNQEDVLFEWVGGADDPQDGVEVLRAAAFMDGVVPMELIEEFREEMEQEDGRRARRVVSSIDALTAQVDVEMFSRRVMFDDAEMGWMRGPREVSDVLALNGVTSWVPTLAVLEAAQSMGSFEFAAMLAIGAAGSLTLIETESDHENVLLALRAAQDKHKSWDALALALDLEVPIAMADEDLTPLMVEVALNERLLVSELPVPGVSGLPLSGDFVEELHIQATKDLLDQAQQEERPEDEFVVRVVRTLMDLTRHHESFDDSFFARTITLLTDHAHAAINLAARHILHRLGKRTEAPQQSQARDIVTRLGALESAPDAATLWTRAVSTQGTLALFALHDLNRPTVRTFDLLAQALMVCDVTRCQAVRDATLDLSARLTM